MKDREGAKVLKPETWLNLHFDFNKSSVISWLYRDILVYNCNASFR
jgi:hypothetical protein